MGDAAIMKSWIAEPLPAEVDAALQRLTRSEDVRRIAVMPDVHLAEGVYVGTIVATRTLLHPQAVGSDIGCGKAALRVDADAEALRDERVAARILEGFDRVVPAMRHPRETAQKALPPGPQDTPLSRPHLESMKRRDGRVQFGTLGRGNHFLEIQADEDGRLWLMLHSGSRAMGRAIFEHHLACARTGSTGLAFLEWETEEGRAFVSDMTWALEYAELSRRRMLEAAAGMIADVLGAACIEETRITCHHNHVRREQHGGEELLVHRKGAIPAAPGLPGIIPGSMGSPSYHVEGRGGPGSLDSSAHGAGRAVSRGQARHVNSLKDPLRQMKGVWFDHRLDRRLLDEAPGAYKNSAPSCAPSANWCASSANGDRC